MTEFGGGRYKAIDDKKLRGGMGEVVVCTDVHLDRKVAIKFLQPQTDPDRIFDEVRALQQIRSKHVVRVYDLVRRQPGDQIGIVQEFLSGEDLTKFFGKGVDDSAYLRTLFQLASGLEDIHAHDLIHRDFKNNNVKHDDENLLKIFDFGLSRPDTTDEAQTTGFKGTRGFGAPELYSNDKVEFTKAIDVYAFAATALHMAAGPLPADLMQMPPQCDRWVSDRGFSTIARSLPPSLVRLLDASFSSDAAARPSMRKVRRSIERHLVRNRHRALVVYGGKTLVLDKSTRSVGLKRGKEGPGVVVDYTGDAFKIRSFTGTVQVNNRPAVDDMILPSSCVITLVDGAVREFVTLDVSRPEVVL